MEWDPRSGKNIDEANERLWRSRSECLITSVFFLSFLHRSHGSKACDDLDSSMLLPYGQCRSNQDDRENTDNLAQSSIARRDSERDECASS